LPAGPYDWNIIELTRYKDGKLVEHWGFMEIQSVIKMMQPATETKTLMPDSISKKAK
jgi:predicted SnoaL-like aldol condensation-catalyzing enzyme